jgi:hypothetical protein
MNVTYCASAICWHSDYSRQVGILQPLAGGQVGNFIISIITAIWAEPALEENIYYSENFPRIIIIDIDNVDTGPLYAVSVHSWATKLSS